MQLRLEPGVVLSGRLRDSAGELVRDGWVKVNFEKKGAAVKQNVAEVEVAVSAAGTWVARDVPEQFDVAQAGAYAPSLPGMGYYGLQQYRSMEELRRWAADVRLPAGATGGEGGEIGWKGGGGGND